eukprot:tig00021742_g23315.t1
MDAACLVRQVQFLNALEEHEQLTTLTSIYAALAREHEDDEVALDSVGDVEPDLPTCRTFAPSWKEAAAEYKKAPRCTSLAEGLIRAGLVPALVGLVGEDSVAVAARACTLRCCPELLPRLAALLRDASLRGRYEAALLAQAAVLRTDLALPALGEPWEGYEESEDEEEGPGGALAAALLELLSVGPEHVLADLDAASAAGDLPRARGRVPRLIKERLGDAKYAPRFAAVVHEAGAVALAALACRAAPRPGARARLARRPGLLGALLGQATRAPPRAFPESLAPLHAAEALACLLSAPPGRSPKVLEPSEEVEVHDLLRRAGEAGGYGDPLDALANCLEDALEEEIDDRVYTFVQAGRYLNDEERHAPGEAELLDALECRRRQTGYVIECIAHLCATSDGARAAAGAGAVPLLEALLDAAAGPCAEDDEGGYDESPAAAWGKPRGPTFFPPPASARRRTPESSPDSDPPFPSDWVPALTASPVVLPPERDPGGEVGHVAVAPCDAALLALARIASVCPRDCGGAAPYSALARARAVQLRDAGHGLCRASDYEAARRVYSWALAVCPESRLYLRATLHGFCADTCMKCNSLISSSLLASSNPSAHVRRLLARCRLDEAQREGEAAFELAVGVANGALWTRARQQLGRIAHARLSAGPLF